MYTEVFKRICKVYAMVFWQNSFEFYFDGVKQDLIGDIKKKTITVKFHDTENTLNRIFKQGSIGLGETYCEGKIEVKDEDYKYFLFIFVRIAYNSRHILWRLSFVDIFRILMAKAYKNSFTKGTQSEDINSHYSLSDWFDDENDSNEFYLKWLNKDYVMYSCGKWDEDIKTLEEAQLNKLDFYSKRLGIDKNSKGKTMLDLGCGWGGVIFYMAEKYGINCTGYTLSVAQALYINKEIKRRGLENLVNVKIENIHNIEGIYDYIISIGVMEHINDYEDLYKKISRSLEENGKALIHSMFHNLNTSKPIFDPFLRKYIFPGGAIPQIKRNIKIFEKYFSFIDRNDLPNKSYPKTIECWYNNFCANEAEIRSLLNEKGKVENIDFAIRVFKHYLTSVYCGLYEDELVANILVYN